MNTCEPAIGVHVIPRGSQLCTCGSSSRTVLDVHAFEAWKNTERPALNAAAIAETPALEGVVPADAPQEGVAASDGETGASPAPKEGRRKRSR